MISTAYGSSTHEAVTGRLVHPIPPVWDAHSEILILGSFPSVKSREVAFFYGHPQNRFWTVTAALFHESTPQTVADRRVFLLRNHLALWDVIASCRITGSSDSSIRDVIPNDIRPLLEAAPIRGIFTNGQTAFRLYQRHLLPQLGREAVCLPSTSPANAAWSRDRLIAAWSIIQDPSSR